MKGPSANLFVYHMRQDDPKRCTASKLIRMGLLRNVGPRHISKRAIVLNPASKDILSSSDTAYARLGLVVIDCSWKRSGSTFTRRFRGINRRLPILLAANPVNYGHPFTLSSVEALSGALILVGCDEQAEFILSKFKWGPTFLDLNREPLEDYRNAESNESIMNLEQDYFPKAYRSLNL